MNLTAVLSLQDHYTDTLKKAVRETTKFRNEVGKTQKALNTTFGKKYTLNLNTGTALANVKKLQAPLQALSNIKVKINIQVNINAATKALNKLFNNIKKLVTTPFQIMFKIANLVAGPFISLIKNVASKAKEIVENSLKGAASLERSSISVEHMIAVNNKGMSADKVKEKAAEYMAGYRTQPELASFDTKDVQEAGTRAISIAQGDSKEATNLLRLAGDMSALTPGKSLEDALDALGELKKGEADSLEDFGFYTKEGSVKAAGKDMGKVKNRSGIALKDAFKGGGEKAGQSAEGLWTSITNTMKNGVADMGKETLQVLKPELKSWADFFKGQGFQKMFKAGSNLMAGIAKGVVERTHKIQNWISSKFLNNVEFQNLPTFKEKFNFVLRALEEGFNGWYKDEGEGMFNSLVSNGAEVLGGLAHLFMVPASKIGKAIGEGLISGLKDLIADHPILSALAGAAGGAFAGSAFGPAGTLVGGAVGLVGGLTTSLGLKFSRKKKKDETPEAGAATNPPKRAIGIPRVPYDNYPALLHQNERVLTAQEARSANNRTPVTINLVAGKQVDPDINRLMNALRTAVESAGFNMAPGGVPA